MFPKLAFLVVAMSIGSVACGGVAPSNEATGEDSADALRWTRTGVVLNAWDNGRAFTIKAGRTIELTLASNPTTGFDWVVKADACFAQPDTTFVHGVGIGAPGKRSFKWATADDASMVGEHTVTLEYKRAWETNVAPAKTFSFTVNVKPRRALVPVVLDDTANGATVSVQAGQPVEIHLASNPTTGFDWQVANTDLGDPTTSFAPGSGIGAGGTRTFIWATTGCVPMTGLHTVTLEYKRAWETGVPAIKTFTVTVDITR